MSQENVPTEKISLDFSESLGNNFGIEDTQLLAGDQLNNFLTSDPDTIKKVDEEEEKKPTIVDNSNQKVEKKEKEEDKPDPNKMLKDILLEDDEDNTPTGADKDNPNKPDKTGNEDETYTTLSKDLLRLGIFSKNSDEETEETINIKTPEEFLDRWNFEKKKGAVNILENFLSSFGDEYKAMFDAVFVNGVKPQEYLQSFAKVEAIKELDLSVETNQERVVRAYYKGLKWDEAKIEAKISKLKDYGDLEEEAAGYHEILLNKEKETVAQMEEQKKKELQEQRDKEIQTVKSLQRIMAEKVKNQEIGGLPITQKDADEVIDYLTTKKYKLASGELLSEADKELLELNKPENHETKLMLGLLLKRKFDLSVVKKTAISKKSDALFNLATKNAKQSNKEKEITSFF